ncbi:MAG TPA: hypothetical protein VIX86_14080 [Streptosporangiaceae bacterium]
MTHEHGPHGPGRAGALPPDLAEVLAEVAPDGTPFRHRQHIHLAYLAIQRHGASRAPDVVAGWIRHVAAYERAPQKFNATMTRAWTELVAHHVTAGTDEAAGFTAFAERNPALLDKRLLSRHYSSRVLASEAAREGWVEPDLVAFPWPAEAQPPGTVRTAGDGQNDR